MTTEILPTRSTLEASARPDPEVLARPKRRRFTAEYRMSIVREADACTRKGELGALLRREGLYSSYLTQWRQQRDRSWLDVEKRGRKPSLRRRPNLCVCARRTRSSPRNWRRPGWWLTFKKTSQHSWGSPSRVQSRRTRRDRCVIPQPPPLPTAVWINPPTLEVPKAQ